jgi:hypothetical protein
MAIELIIVEEITQFSEIRKKNTFLDFFFQRVSIFHFCAAIACHFSQA